MSFNFSSLMDRDNNPPNPSFSRNASFTYLTQQSSIRARLTSADVSRRGFDLPPNPVDIRGSIQRELEKERIRAELIREEILRRRILEEEVKRELIIEEELRIRRYESRFDMGGLMGPMRYEQSRVPLLTNYEHGGGDGLSRDVRSQGGFEARAFQRDPIVGNAGGSGSSMGLHEIKEFNGVLAPQLTGSSKDKVIILAKPSVNLTDIKRKAMMPPVGGAIEVCKKQKTEEDWSCALCRITATSKQGLHEHFQGKKHKARERGMVSQRTGFGTGPSGPLPDTSSTSSSKPFTLPVTTSTPTLKNDDKIHSALSPSPSDVDHTLIKSNETSTKKPGPKFRFFCEICQRGAYSMKVFNSHNRSRRHLAKLAEFNKTDRVAFVEAYVEKPVVEENNGVEDEDKVLVVAGGEGMTTETTTQEVVCSEVVDKKVLEIVGGETMAPTDHQTICIDVEDKKALELAAGVIMAPKTIDQEFVCNEVDDKEKVLEQADTETVAPLTTYQEFVCNEVEDKDKILEVSGGQDMATLTTYQESVCKEVTDKNVLTVEVETMALKTTDQELIGDQGEDKEMVPEVAGEETMLQ